jgi:hypothetical protein
MNKKENPMTTIVINGETIEVEDLGKSTFTHAYRAGDGTVYINTKDNIKDIFVMLSGLPHIPEIEYVGNNYYKMPFYRVFAYLEPEQIPEQATKDWSNAKTALYNGSAGIEAIKDDVTPELYDTLNAFVYATEYLLSGANYNPDFHIYNVALDENDKMIILDPIALWSGPV